MRTLLLATTALMATPSLAEGSPPRDTRLDANPEIIVTAPYPREAFFVLSGVSVLSGNALARQTRATIGETLARLPGVSSTFFGPNASRPVLRGLQGERVRVLTDGIGSFDVSNTSVDHAVALSPFAADRIEVVRGPEVLLYGSSAIGGVVNSSDRRIPRGIPEDDVHLDAQAGYATAAREGQIAGSIDVAVAPRFVVNVTGGFLEARDQRVGGFVYSRALREEALAAGLDPDEVNRTGKLDNTAARGFDVSGGATWFFGGESSVGVAVTRIESRYGVPNRLELPGDGAEEAEGEEAEGDITLDMRQTRVDARLDAALGDGFIERLRIRGGYADYVHDEIEPDGAIGTSFASTGGEVRVEAVQREQDGWKGASGFQFLSRRLDAQGEEAYIPENRTRQFGLFTLQEFELGALKAEASGRFERADVRSGIVDFDRSFNALSVSLGASLALGRSFRAGLAYTHAERAPAAEELLTDGPHFATQAFEVGDPDLRKERSDGIEGTLRGRGEGWRVDVSVFHSRFSNYIFLLPTDEEADGLPVFLYTQDRARFTGVELDGDLRLVRWGAGELRGSVLFDWVKATLGDGNPVPLIPPLRVLAGLDADHGPFTGRVEIEHVTAQTRVAAFERPTDRWTMVNLSVGWKPLGPDGRSILMVQANNLFDVDARRHASFIKDFAPLPGRDIRMTARFSF